MPHSLLRLPPQWPPRLRDTALVALAALLLLFELRTIDGYGPYLEPDAVANALYVVIGLALLLRRRWPLVTAGLVLTTSYTYQALGYVTLATMELATLVALFTAAAHGRRVPRLVAFPGIALWLLAVNAAAPASLDVSGLVIMFVILVGAWMLGERERAHRRYLAMLDERAALLERQRDLEAAEVATAERTRIARELHDVIAHGLGVVVVQAEAALHSPGAAAPDTRRPIEAIRTTSRSALTEARRVLGMLRGPAAGDGTLPQPGLDDLPTLVADFAAAGLDVDWSLTGARRPLDQGLDLSAYRIIEEALTNALRHAAPCRVRLEVTFADTALDLSIRDDGPAPPTSAAPIPGHGLVGMRERVAMLNGALEVGPAPGGGYLVRATLPLPPLRVVAPDMPSDIPTDIEVAS